MEGVNLSGKEVEWMQNALLKRIFNLTATKQITWQVAENRVSNCNRYEGESETHDFVIMEIGENSYVGWKEKSNDDFDIKDIKVFIKIIKATKIKKREKVLA